MLRTRHVRTFVFYLQQNLGVMLELPAVVQRAAPLSLWVESAPLCVFFFCLARLGQLIAVGYW